VLLRLAKNGSLLCLIGLPLAGCSLFGGGKLEECRSESEQLLSDYRRQRDRAERLELQNRTLQQQVAEAEKQLALADREDAERLAQRTPSANESPGEQAPAPQETPQEKTPDANAGQKPQADDPPQEVGAVGAPEDGKPVDDGWRSIPQTQP
jgi:septal ring factor EnvC (AmiA/AmiB activator)